MKKRIFTILAFIMIAVLALAACSPQPEPAVEEPAEMEELEEAFDEPEGDMEEEMEEPASEEGEMEEIDVAALIEERVAGNHGLDQIFNATKTREEWQETLERMNGYGAGMSDEEIELIIDYLLGLQESAEPAEEAMEEIDVEALIEERVAGNHGLDQIFNATKTREEWQETLERMNGYGAGMSEEEIELIIEYLLNR